jgi:hypothetical protein
VTIMATPARREVEEAFRIYLRLELHGRYR